MDEKEFENEKVIITLKIHNIFEESKIPPMIICSILCFFAGKVANSHGASTDTSLRLLQSSLKSGLTGCMSFAADEIHKILENDELI